VRRQFFEDQRIVQSLLDQGRDDLVLLFAAFAALRACERAPNRGEMLLGGESSRDPIKPGIRGLHPKNRAVSDGELTRTECRVKQGIVGVICESVTTKITQRDNRPRPGFS
jgi:hypothetical protein